MTDQLDGLGVFLTVIERVLQLYRVGCVLDQGLKLVCQQVRVLPAVRDDLKLEWLIGWGQGVYRWRFGGL